MNNQVTSKETQEVEQIKSTWNTPELEVFSIKDKTQAGPAGVSDAGIFS
ncbi:hypothetical protein [Emticicia sp. TH156]|nr:hypothetical protein [Emticicia sp. TH156]